VPADIAAEIKETLGREWLPTVYTDKIRSQRTRAILIDVPAKENLPEVHHTLLGIELKVGRRRFPSPDLSAARYMLIFARLGCREFAIPYDITQIAAAADILETAWQRTFVLLEEKALQRSSRGRSMIRSRLITMMRTELTAIGAGDQMPKFDRPTRKPQP
jgi:hypothetical protein